MKKLIAHLMLVMGLFSLNAWAQWLPGESMAGVYTVKDNNIISISGRTYVKTSETQILDCDGTPAASLPNGSDVQYTIVEPVKGPIPTLKTITRICS